MFLGKERCRVRSGLGIMIYETEGFLYIGNWANNNMQGLGYMIFKDGSYYQGEFYLNKPHGYGEYYNFGKTWIFKGKWKSGVK